MRSDGSRSAASSSVRRVKRATGASAVRATSGAKGSAEGHARRAHEQEHEHDAVELAVDLVERARHLDGSAMAQRRA